MKGPKGTSPNFLNISLKSNFKRYFFPISFFIKLIIWFFFIHIWTNSWLPRKKPNRASTPNDNCFCILSLIWEQFFPINSFKKLALECYQQICCIVIVAQIWENRKSYFNGLTICIGTYVKRIKYLCQLTTSMHWLCYCTVRVCKGVVCKSSYGGAYTALNIVYIIQK